MREQIFLRDDVTAAEVITEAAALGYAPEVFYETDPRPFEIEFHANQRRGTTVNYVQDKQIGVNYLNIDGPEAVVVRLALEKALRHYDRSTSYERAATDPDLDERVTALFHLALARGPVPEPHVLRLLGDFLHHNEDLVRNAAVLSIAYFEWPAALPMLDDLIRRETNPRILNDATLLRSRFQAPQTTPATLDFGWPEFENKQPLDGGRSWTAKFDSFDEYRDDCYYVVKLWNGDELVNEFMVQVGTYWAGDNLAVPTFTPELHRRIAEIAATGQTNTEWRGLSRDNKVEARDANVTGPTDSWFATFRAINSDLVSGWFLRSRADDDAIPEIAAAGLWWVLPFARSPTAGLNFALRLMPPHDKDRFPVVLVTEEFSVRTKASRLSHLIPSRVGSMLTSKTGWEQIEGMTADEWRDLEAAHAAFGGTDQLAGVKGVLADQTLRSVIENFQVTGQSGPHIVFMTALTEIAKRVDPAPETGLFREYSLAVDKEQNRANREERTFVPMPLEGSGCFRAAVAAIGFGEATSTGDPEAELTSAWALAQEPPSLDAQNGNAIDVSIDAARMVVRRKSRLTPAQKRDPLLPALEKLAEKGTDYDGACHIDAAAGLAGEQPERAFNALITASFFNAAVGKPPRPEVVREAQKLAKVQAWTDIAMALEQR